MTKESRTSSEGWGLLKNRPAMTLLLAGLATQAVALTLGGALKVLVAGTGIALVLLPIRKSLSWTRWDAAAAVVAISLLIAMAFVEPASEAQKALGWMIVGALTVTFVASLLPLLTATLAGWADVRAIRRKLADLE